MLVRFCSLACLEPNYTCLMWLHYNKDSPSLTSFLQPHPCPIRLHYNRDAPSLTSFLSSNGCLLRMEVDVSSDDVELSRSLTEGVVVVVVEVWSPLFPAACSVCSAFIRSSLETPWKQRQRFNSLAPGRFYWHFRWVIFMLILVTDDWCISCEIAIRWM